MRHSIKTLLCCSFVFTGLFIINATVNAEEKWTPLFDGKTLEGWVQKGGQAKYHVEDGQIVGTSVTKTPNSFLATKKHYANFILELEFLPSAVLELRHSNSQ